MSTLPARPGLPDALRGAEHRSSTPLGIGRGTRVLLLTVALVAMSIVDLYITLLYLRGAGLAEENPIARLVMAHGSASLLTVWKAMTVLPAVIVLTRYRRRISAEILAWVGCAVLLGVTLRWVQYAEETDLLVLAMAELQAGVDERWVTHAD